MLSTGILFTLGARTDWPTMLLFVLGHLVLVHGWYCLMAYISSLVFSRLSQSAAIFCWFLVFGGWKSLAPAAASWRDLSRIFFCFTSESCCEGQRSRYEIGRQPFLLFFLVLPRVPSSASLPWHDCSLGSWRDVLFPLGPAGSCRMPSLKRHSPSPDSLYAGGCPHTTGSGRLFTICPDMAKLLAVVALRKGIPWFIWLPWWRCGRG
jgi:hypothetical protein